MAARTALDARLRDRQVRSLVAPPRGWVRAIRDALGMSSRQLAARMNVSQPAITQLERSEAAGAIQLNTLRRAADALDCELVYALVPRVSLDDTVRKRATEIARAQVGNVDRTMRLEGQGLSAEQLSARIDEYTAKLVVEGRLWDDAAQ